MVISPDLVYKPLTKTVILFLRMGIYTLRIIVFTVMFFVIKSWQKKPRWIVINGRLNKYKYIMSIKTQIMYIIY